MPLVVAPVRPTRKQEFLDTPMDAYLKMTDERGRIFDPWIRTHLELGAELLNICQNSVVITASFKRWKLWLGVDLDKTEEFTPPLGLAKLEVDPANRRATYREPNVWMRYRVS